MNVLFRGSFERDLKKIKSADTRRKIRQSIELVESADDPRGIVHMRKLSGTDNFYRIRIGSYRIGLVIDGSAAEFVRVLHRRDIYKFFP